MIFNSKRIPLLHRLPMTQIRLFIARIIYRLLRIVLRINHHSIHRKGINYEVDLSEAFDLSIYLFGNFQGYIIHTRYFSVLTDPVIFDIGANIGSMALGFAQRFPQGYVYAFEPDPFVSEKLLRNLSLNPELSQRVTPIQALVTDPSSMGQSRMTYYTNWRLDRRDGHTHPIHGGTIHAVDSIPCITVDDFCKDRGIRRVDLIKIDTEGYEFQILKGAQRTITDYLPFIVFEAGLYIMQENHITFEHYFNYLTSFGYTLINIKNGHPVNLENYIKEIPLRFTMDIVAIPPQ